MPSCIACEGLGKLRGHFHKEPHLSCPWCDASGETTSEVNVPTDYGCGVMIGIRELIENEFHGKDSKCNDHDCWICAHRNFMLGDKIKRNIGESQHFSRTREPDLYVEVKQWNHNKVIFIWELYETIQVPSLLSYEDMEKVMSWARGEI